MRVLVIEDDIGVREFLHRGLYKKDCTIDQTGDGVEGKEMIMKNQYDVVIIDLRLPDLDGAELVKHIREGQNKVPIIILTAIQDEATKNKLLKLGANDYISKPFSINELYERMLSFVEEAS